MMRRIPSISILVLWVGMALPALAQTSQKPHLDLVRGLRKEALADLALQYLDELRAGTPRPEIAIVMPFEYARTYLDLAAQENDEGKRSSLISKAKHELETFISANPTHELAPQANVELARMLSLQGKNLMRKARKLEGKLQEPEMLQARGLLQSAAQKYDATANLLNDQLKQLEGNKTPEGMKLHKELVDFRLRALLDQGINLYDMGDTFVGDEIADVESRGKQYKEAKKT